MGQLQWRIKWGKQGSLKAHVHYDREAWIRHWFVYFEETTNLDPPLYCTMTSRTESKSSEQETLLSSGSPVFKLISTEADLCCWSLHIQSSWNVKSKIVIVVQIFSIPLSHWQGWGKWCTINNKKLCERQSWCLLVKLKILSSVIQAMDKQILGPKYL